MSDDLQEIYVPGQSEPLYFPKSMSDQQIHSVLVKQFPLAKGTDNRDELIGREVPPKPEASITDKVIGAGEAGLSTLSSLTTGAVGYVGGALGGLAGQVATGKLGTQEGGQLAQQAASEGAQKMTYQPTTEAGKEDLQAIGSVVDASKIAGLPMGDMTTLSNLARAGSEVGQGAKAATSTAGAAIKDRLQPAEPQMAGVGSAYASKGNIRDVRAANLDVPIKLTKGERERTFEQKQFEAETAKDAELGAPLRKRKQETTENIARNFDTWIDQTGSETAGNLRATGKVVTQAVVDKMQKAKGEINAAYDKARSAGEMEQPVDITPIQQYIESNRAEAINAPILASVEQKVKSLTGEGKTLSINDLEEVRKMVGKLSGKDATNAHFGKEVKTMIDQMTEGQGGTLYKQARQMRTQYAHEFENKAVIDKLVSTKAGTSDRKVAYEDVFDHSILKGSLDDVRAVRRTLQTSGDQGKQAWKELQGATLNHIKEEITKSMSIDEGGNRVISPAKLDRLVSELDKDGKLDFIFGKQGAQKIRDINGVAQDVYTSPPGSVNFSNTASALKRFMNLSVNAIGSAQVPVISPAVKWGAKKLEQRKTMKQVEESLQ